MEERELSITETYLNLAKDIEENLDLYKEYRNSLLELENSDKSEDARINERIKLATAMADCMMEVKKRRLAIDIIIPKIRPINPLMCIKAVSEIAKAVAHSPKGKALRRNRFLLNILKSYGIIGGPDENLFLSIEDASNADLAKTPFSVCCKQDNIQKIMAQFVNEDLANEYILQLAKKEAKDNSPPEKYFVSTMYAWQPARF